MSDWIIFLLVVYPLPIPDQPPDGWKQSLYRVARVLEINQLQSFDPESEVKGDFEYAIVFYRVRFKSISSCPPASMSTIFPNYTTAEKKYLKLGEHAKLAEAWSKTYLHRRQELKEYHAHVTRSWHLWYYVYIATHPFSTPYAKRLSLQYMKEDLGDEDFYGARLPDPIIPLP
jgi:hypothetical protein